MLRVGHIRNARPEEILKGAVTSLTAEQLLHATGGNTGNIVFIEAAKLLLQNSIVNIDWSSELEYVQENVDLILVSCANQLGAHVNLEGWKEALDRFNKPCILLGIGAQSPSLIEPPDLPPSTIKFIECVSRRRFSTAPNIATRGLFSSRVIEDIGIDSIPIACPSLFINPDIHLGNRIFQAAAKTDPSHIRLSVAAGNIHDPDSFLLERILKELAIEYDGCYIVQHTVEMLKLALGASQSIDRPTLDHILYVYGLSRNCEDKLIDFYARYSNFFFDVVSWIKGFRDYNMCIGPRFHGVAIATQAGTPSLGISVDSRTQEMFNECAIKSISSVDFLRSNKEDIISLGIWNSQDADCFDANRGRKAAIMIDFLTRNGLVPSEHLLRLSTTS
jgi:hypothetical protein